MDKQVGSRLSCIPTSLFDAISRGQMGLAEWLDFASELGLDGVECGPLLVRPLGPATPAEFRRLADARGLAVSNFTGYSDFTHPDPDVRECEVAAAIRNLEVALELGAPSVRVLTGQQRPGVQGAQGILWVAEAIRRVATEAARLGLRLNVENHTKAFTWTAFDFAMYGDVFLAVMDALRDAPVGVQFDTANPLVAGEDPLALFEQVRTRIGYVHLNDVRRPGVFEFAPVGTGIAPIREVLLRLRADGYSGWVGIEEASRTGQEGFRQAVRYVRGVLAA
ncbi:MAG TPA: sugar phosphate isomerase/epimerase family protein [bacterium]|nr:sugar phosphate isomerase/epimerase family protein [bacterium]